MTCEKHKLRKRKDCPDCIAESGSTFSEPEVITPVTVVKRSDLKVSAIRDEMSIARQALVEEPSKLLPVDTPKSEERKYIRVLIEAEIERALAKIKQELKGLQNIGWEHLDISLTHFSIQLMHKLGGEGWVYKDTYRGDVAKISGCKEDTVIMTRIKSPNWPIKPDFNKRSVREKYAEVA